MQLNISTDYAIRIVYCRNIIAMCALKKNITQNMGRPRCAAT